MRGETLGTANQSEILPVETGRVEREETSLLAVNEPQTVSTPELITPITQGTTIKPAESVVTPEVKPAAPELVDLFAMEDMYALQAGIEAITEQGIDV